MANYNYESIESESAENGDSKLAARSDEKGHQWKLYGAIACSAVLGCAILSTVLGQLQSNSEEPTVADTIPMPSGVNLGSWLSLEDYFYVGLNAVEVATPFGKTQGNCLPPLHNGSGPRWNSETDLLANLVESTGSLEKALRVFHAHRITFVTDDDLADLAKLGVVHVRVPLSWCWTDASPETLDESTAGTQFVCEDPFYPGVQWPAIPKSLLANFLRSCTKHGITATLDIHTYPGATSIGTFSGLWPKWPRFWENDDPANPADIGRTILANAVAWLEDLAESDPVAFQGFRALSPMNEPAHLAGLFNPGESKAYLPNLPADLEAPFLKSLHQHQGTEVQSGPHLRVLLWLSQSVETFRNSKLPQLGKEIHVNIHESVFRSSDLPEDPNGETGVAAAHVVAAWWSTATSSAERSSWAILDMHHYHAWDEPCAGTSDGLGNYTCGDDVSRSITLQRCAAWASNVYRRAVDDECGPGARLASAEFSASTHHQVHRACNDIGTLHATYAAQVEDAKSADVELFFWSWKMPYGDSFRNAWSFKHLMYLLGVTSQPDESNYQCGVPVLFEDLPSDDLFSN